jgi:predicted dehydrogenase
MVYKVTGVSAVENVESNSGLSRRDLLKVTGKALAASALAGVVLPRHVYAGETNTIQLALVGAGGRGSGAAANALSTRLGPVKLSAIADVFPDKLNNTHDSLKKNFNELVDVPEDRRFIGFDAYKQAMDTLKKGDVVILTTPPAFRWVQFKYAIERGLNVFMEKPVTVDGPSTRKMLDLEKLSVQKNLKVGVGLMCRHCESRGELFKRIKDGQLGELNLLRAYRVHGPVGSAFVKPRPADTNELMYQIRNFHGFLWASGGCFSDFNIHNIDECCWMKDAWPVEAKGYGGRHYRGDFIDQNFDTYSVEYTFADGAKLILEARVMPGCDDEFASYCHGSKGSAVISQSGHAPSKARIFKAQRMLEEDVVWRCAAPEPNPYQLEWDHLMHAIRQDLPYNEVKRGAEASLVTSMGRMACHTGKIVTFDQMLNLEHEFAPDVDKLVLNGPAPILADANGKYPVPAPGLKKTREF